MERRHRRAGCCRRSERWPRQSQSDALGRISRIIQDYDAQGIHRTGTDVDDASGAWLRGAGARGRRDGGAGTVPPVARRRTGMHRRRRGKDDRGTAAVRRRIHAAGGRERAFGCRGFERGDCARRSRRPGDLERRAIARCPAPRRPSSRGRRDHARRAARAHADERRSVRAAVRHTGGAGGVDRGGLAARGSSVEASA